MHSLVRLLTLAAPLIFGAPAKAADCSSAGNTVTPCGVQQDDAIYHSDVTLGVPGTFAGTVKFSGATSGTVTVTPQAVAGTGVTVTLPNTSGTIAANASSPLVLSTVTGTLTCPTCVTSSTGGAITGTAPISVSAAGVVSLATPLALNYGGTNASLTASNGGIVYSTASAFAVLNGTATANQMLLSGASGAPSWSTATWPATASQGQILNASAANVWGATATPTLGVPGSVTGSLGFAGNVSGTVTLIPQSTAGTVTLTLPNTSGTIASSATAPLNLNATTGALSLSTPLALTYGGSNASLTASNGGIVWSNASQLQILSGTATANQLLLSGASGSPAWSTATYPATAAQGAILNASAANVVAATVTPVLGAPGASTGTLGFAGITSGTVTITPQSAAGTPTLTLPNTTGTLVSTAASPLSVNSTTGQVSLSGIVPTANGGSTLFVGVTAGTANAQTIATPTPNNFTLTNYYTVCATIGAGLTNTSAMTLSVGGTTATAVNRRNTSGLAALVGGEVLGSQSYCFQYDGTVWELLTQTYGHVEQKAVSYTATAADGNGDTYIFTAAATLTLPQSTTIPNDWKLYTFAQGGAVTITPNAADSINGGTLGASVTLPQGIASFVLTDGAGHIYVPGAVGIPNAALANMAANTVKCNSSSISGNPTDCNYPTVNVRDPAFMASGSASTTTGSITTGTASLSLAAALDFANGQYIRVNHAGAAFATNPPTGLTITPTGTTGATAYQYQIASLDATGGLGAAITAVATATGNATLSVSNYNALSWTAPVSGPIPASYAVYGNTAGSMTLLAIVKGTSWNDVGTGTMSPLPDNIPSAPQGAALADWLLTTISSGAGSTTLTLGANASTTATSQTVSHDDTTPIQNAINALSSTGGVVYLPQGTYKVTSQITDIGNLTIRGAGIGATTIKLPTALAGYALYAFSINNVSYSDFTFDAGSFYSGAAANNASAAIYAQSITGFYVRRVAINNIGTFGILGQGITTCAIEDSTFNLVNGSIYQNEAINFTQSLQNSYCNILRNNFTNVGIEPDGQYINISDNNFIGWKFGGGITTGPDTKSHHYRIERNFIVGSGAVIDVNVTYLTGVENWSFGSVISDNIVTNSCGAGILNGGKTSVISGNVVYDNVQCGIVGANTTGGIFNQYTNATYNGSSSIITGNQSFNSNGAAGSQIYGYAENASVTGNILGPNNFNTNKTAPVNLAATTNAAVWRASNNSGTAPTLTSCGTSPSIPSNATDSVGQFTAGSATTACTLTFNQAYASAPICTVAPIGNGTFPTYSTSTTAISFTTLIASGTYYYNCLPKLGG